MGKEKTLLNPNRAKSLSFSRWQLVEGRSEKNTSTMFILFFKAKSKQTHMEQCCKNGGGPRENINNIQYNSDGS